MVVFVVVVTQFLEMWSSTVSHAYKLLSFLQAAKTDLFYSTFCVHSST